MLKKQDVRPTSLWSSNNPSFERGDEGRLDCGIHGLTGVHVYTNELNRPHWGLQGQNVFFWLISVNLLLLWGTQWQSIPSHSLPGINQRLTMCTLILFASVRRPAERIALLWWNDIQRKKKSSMKKNNNNKEKRERRRNPMWCLAAATGLMKLRTVSSTASWVMKRRGRCHSTCLPTEYEYF